MIFCFEEGSHCCVETVPGSWLKEFVESLVEVAILLLESFYQLVGGGFREQLDQ